MIPPPLAPPERRNPLGWILLAAIGLPLLAFITTTFFETAYEPTTKAGECVSDLRIAVRGSFGRIAQDTEWREAEGCVRSIASKRFSDEVTAMVYAAATHERGRKVLAADVAVLTHSKYPRRRAFASVYLEPHLSRTRAAQLAGRMPDTSFVYELAKVHALEKAGVKVDRSRYLGKLGLNVAVVLVFVAALAGALLGVALWCVYAGLRSGGMLRPLGHPLGALSPHDADRCALRAAQYLIAYIAASVLASLLGPCARLLKLPQPLESTILVVHQAILLGCIVALAARPLDGKRLRLLDMGITAKGFGVHAAWGLAGLVANLPIFLALSILSNMAFGGIPQVEHPVLTDAKHSIGFVEPLLLFVGASFLAPIVEETWFRGTLLPALSSALRSPVWGILATSLIFASFHPTGLPSWLPLAAIGAMGAMLTYQTKSLVPAMVMHALHNGVTLVFAMLIS